MAARKQQWALSVILALSSAGCSHYDQYRVKQGDTLYSISWQHGYDYRKVAAWNGLTSPYIIKKGQVIQIKPPAKKRSSNEWTLLSKPSTTPPAASTSGRTITQSKKTSRETTTAQKAVSPTSSPVKKSNSSTRPVKAPAPQTKPSMVSSIRWQWPAQGEVKRGSDLAIQQSKGVQIVGKAGQAVRAAALGRVVYSGNGLKGYGNLVIIKHNEYFLSAYANNRDIFVKPGDHVQAGQKIAAMGSGMTSQYALYFEIRHDGRPVDPLRYLPKTR